MDLIPYALLTSLIPSASFNLTTLAVQPIMYSFTSLLLVGGLAMQAVLSLPDPSRVKEREAELLKRSVDSFIATESPIALTDLLCNIGAAGTCAAGASSGIVIASPDKTNPNCKVSTHFERYS
jgi:glucoamylase